MKLDLSRTELEVLSADILSRLEMSAHFFGEGITDERRKTERASLWDARDMGTEFLESGEMLPAEYDFLYADGRQGSVGAPEGKIRLTSYSAPRSAAAGEVSRAADMEAVSEYFRRDSRRYDGVLKKY